MIEDVSAEEVREFVRKAKSGLPIKTIVHESGIPATRIARYLRLYGKFGDDFFPPNKSSMGRSINNNRELKMLVEKYQLTRTDIADMLGASPNTVKNWLRSEGAVNHTLMPTYALDLIRIRVAEERGDTQQAKGSDTPQNQ